MDLLEPELPEYHRGGIDIGLAGLSITVSALATLKVLDSLDQ